MLVRSTSTLYEKSSTLCFNFYPNTFVFLSPSGIFRVVSLQIVSLSSVCFQVFCTVSSESHRSSMFAFSFMAFVAPADITHNALPLFSGKISVP